LLEYIDDHTSLPQLGKELAVLLNAAKSDDDEDDVAARVACKSALDVLFTYLYTGKLVAPLSSIATANASMLLSVRNATREQLRRICLLIELPALADVCQATMEANKAHTLDDADDNDDSDDSDDDDNEQQQPRRELITSFDMQSVGLLSVQRSLGLLFDNVDERKR